MEIRGVKSVRSFGRPESRKFGNVLIIACTILSLFLLSLLKARYCPSPYGKSQVALKFQELPTKHGVKMVTDKSAEDPALLEDEDAEAICYESSERSKTCEAQGDIRVRGSSKTIFINSSPMQQEWKIKPYTRKNDAAALSYVKEWSLKSFPADQSLPQCTINHTSPAIIFSTGGFTGNLFHDFTDVLIPLFITSRQFNGEVHFVVSDTKSWWLNKFNVILKQLSNHEIIDVEKENDEEVVIRCFPRVIIGPKFHKELGIDAKKSTNYSMADFKDFLRKAFGLERTNTMSTSTSASSLVEEGYLRKPRLLIISRKGSRIFLNEKGMVAMATSLGFDVRVGEPDVNTDVGKFARLVNSADVMIGVHGAGLTNMVFLPAGAVVIQVIPLGGLEWLARGSFEAPAKDMGVKYLEYGIREDESSLIEKYSRDHPVLKDPYSVHKKGWGALREVYLDNQNVRPHLGRLRDTLMEALKLLPQKS